MKKVNSRLVTVNTLGALGYVVIIFCWAMLIGVTIYLWLQSPEAATLMTSPNDPPVADVSVGGPSWLWQLVAYALTAIVALISLGVFLAFPYVVGKFLSRILRRMLLSLKIIPTIRILYATKCIVLALPLVGFAVIESVSQPQTLMVPTLHLVVIAAALLAMAVLFPLQIVLAKKWKLTDTAVW